MIKGKNVNLWPLEKHDLLTNLKWANDRELISLTGMPRFPKSMVETEHWYQQYIRQNTNKFFIIKTKNGESIGNLELNNIDWINKMLEIGILLGKKDFRGKGFGTDATLAALNYTFQELDLNRVYLSVIEYNKDAIKLYEKCGFTHEGIKREAFYYKGKYWNVMEMAILKKEFLEIKNKLKDFFS